MMMFMIELAQDHSDAEKPRQIDELYNYMVWLMETICNIYTSCQFATILFYDCL